MNLGNFSTLWQHKHVLQFEGGKRCEVWLIQPASWCSVNSKRHNSGRIWNFVEKISGRNWRETGGNWRQSGGKPRSTDFQKWQVELFVVLENVRFEKSYCFQLELVNCWLRGITSKPGPKPIQAEKKTSGKYGQINLQRQKFLPKQKIWKQEVLGITQAILGTSLIGN